MRREKSPGVNVACGQTAREAGIAVRVRRDYDWAEPYVTAAEELGDLVDLRWALEAKVQPSVRKAAITLRAAAITAITGCRETPAAELESNPELPRNLDALIFGPFDDLAAEAEPKSPKAPAEPTAPPDSSEPPEPA